jgi:hypothetical protein
MTLQDRCKAWFERVSTPLGRLRVGDAVASDLADFVRSEIGRAGAAQLDDSEPLVLYFATVQDRSEFVALIMEAKPGMVSRKWPN